MAMVIASLSIVMTALRIEAAGMRPARRRKQTNPEGNGDGNVARPLHPNPQTSEHAKKAFLSRISQLTRGMTVVGRKLTVGFNDVLVSFRIKEVRRAGPSRF